MQRALADCGLAKRDVDGFCCVGMGGGAGEAMVMAEYLGFDHRYVDGTMTGGEADPFGSLATDYQFFYPVIASYERWVSSLRVAGGTSAGGAFREQFYIPAAYNLRTLSEGDLSPFLLRSLYPRCLMTTRAPRPHRPRTRIFDRNPRPHRPRTRIFDRNPRPHRPRTRRTMRKSRLQRPQARIC